MDFTYFAFSDLQNRKPDKIKLYVKLMFVNYLYAIKRND